MSWYGTYNQSAKQLDQLLDSKPSLAQLLLSTDFIPQLKSFNPKLLDYVTNSPTLPAEMVNYISVAPGEGDSVDRKYKLPVLTIQMIQTETICVINALLKPNADQSNSFLLMFDMLKSRELLPLLAGYFNRVNFTLCRARYKQTLQSVFSSTQYLELLVSHSYNQAIANCLPLYLCVQTGKNIVLSQQKIAIKMGVIRSMLNKIQQQKNSNDYKSVCMIENIFSIFRQIVEKYYLISHGKQMLEILLQQKYVQTIVTLIASQNQNSIYAMHLALSFLKYYSLSAFNSDQGTQQLTKKNMQRLDNQPFVRLIMANFKPLLERVKKQKVMNLYGYTLLQVLCHCITLSSVKIFNLVKQYELFPNLIDLVYKNQNCNILHKLAQRAFLHIFTTQKKIYQYYKQYMFCNISIIDLTTKRLLDMFPEGLQKAKYRGYFGIIMKIVKIYSSISTSNIPIRDAITAKTQTWNKITKKIIKPYEIICKQQIGQMQDVPQTPPIQYTVRKTDNQLMPRLIQNAEALQQIKRQQQTMPKTLELNDMKKEGPTLSDTKIQDQSFFKSPLQDSINKRKSNFQGVTANMTTSITSSMTSSNISQQSAKNDELGGDKKAFSYTQFMNKRKAEVGEQIKMQRSQSGQKRLSADKKTRLTSPSPSRKRNSWKQQSQQQPQTQKHPLSHSQTPTVPTPAKDLPKIPLANKIPASPTYAQATGITIRNLARSSVQQVRKPEFEDQSKRMMSLSTANLESLKKTTIIRINQQPQPSQKKYRKIQDKDKALFAYLGINC